jgi:hypothetical protein
MTDVMQDADVWMIQTRDGLRLAFETLFADGVIREMCRKNLDSDRALEARVTPAIYLAHPASAQRFHNLIGP